MESLQSVGDIGRNLATEWRDDSIRGNRSGSIAVGYAEKDVDVWIKRSYHSVRVEIASIYKRGDNQTVNINRTGSKNYRVKINHKGIVYVEQLDYGSENLTKITGKKVTLSESGPKSESVYHRFCSIGLQETCQLQGTNYLPQIRLG